MPQLGKGRSQGRGRADRIIRALQVVKQNEREALSKARELVSDAKKIDTLLQAIPPQLRQEAEEAIDGLIRKIIPPVPTFVEFVERTSNFKLEGWQVKICDRLERLLSETGKRILLHAPPQWGKSLLVSQRFPAYAIGRNPDIRIRLCCYNISRASSFSEVNIAILKSREYSVMFPDPACRIQGQCNIENWSVPARLAARDAQTSFSALGIRSGFVGLGADIVIIDDPYANREEAFSQTVNEAIWNWYKDLVSPRLNPSTNVVVMFHRWSHNDLAGRLLEQGGWEHMRFPAIADGLPGDESGIPVGDSISPRFTVDFINTQRRNIGESMWASLYQGLPAPDGGNLIKEQWFRYYERTDHHYCLPVPGGVERYQIPHCWRFITADLAASEKKSADWTVVAAWAVTEKRQLLLLEVMRERTDSIRARKMIQECFSRWDAVYAAVERNGIGLPICQQLAAEGYAIRPVYVRNDKIARTQSTMQRYETGAIYHPANSPPWLKAVETELTMFPAAANDDVVDCVTLATMMVSYGGSVFHEFNAGIHVSPNVVLDQSAGPLLCGWAFPPAPSTFSAWVMAQVDDEGRITVLAAMTSRPSESIADFCNRVESAMVRNLGKKLPKIQHYSNPKHTMHGASHDTKSGAWSIVAYGRPDYHLVGAPERERQPDNRGWILLPSEPSRQIRDETLRSRLRTLINGRPAIVIHEDCGPVIEALSGAYAYRTNSATGLLSAEPEQNVHATVAEALSCIVCRVYATSHKAEEDEEDERLWRITARGAGRRKYK